MTANYFVRLEQFEGPLDLLLHLIRVHELNIFDINLLTLTTQYLDYLRLVQFKDIKDAAYFLEMAANLIEIKSKNLIPQEQGAESAADSLEEDEVNPDDLQKRLQLLDAFQKAGTHFARLTSGDSLTIASNEFERLEPQFAHLDGKILGDPSVLLILYEQMLSTLSERQPTTVTAMTESITITDMMGKITNFIDKLRFYMLQQVYARMNSRYELIAYILAVLQLAREHQIKIFQDETWGPIWLAHNDHAVSPEEFVAEPSLPLRSPAGTTATGKLTPEQGEPSLDP